MTISEKMKQVKSLLDELEDLIREQVTSEEDSLRFSSYELIEEALLRYAFIMSNIQLREE